MKRRCVFIHAYTFTNLGDDLFVQMLCRRYPDILFWIACLPGHKRAFRGISNLRVFPVIPAVDGLLRKLGTNLSINTWHQRLLARCCLATVNIGGSMFIENDRWSYKAAQYGRRILKGQPFFLLGSNFGPYQDPQFLTVFRDLLQNAADACFRDQASYLLFADLAPARYAPDILFALDTRLLRSHSETRAQLGQTTRRQVVISLIDLSERTDLAPYQAVYQEAMLAFVRSCQQKGYFTVLMGFCAKEGDGRAVDAIYKQLSDTEKTIASCYLYAGNTQEALSIFDGTELVIATRFHAMILGWTLGKKVLPILYSDKSLHVIEDIGYDGPYVKVPDLSRLQVDAMMQLLMQDDNRDIVATNIARQAKLAEQQFLRLDELLSQHHLPGSEPHPQSNLSADNRSIL